MSELSGLRDQCLQGLNESDANFAVAFIDRLLPLAVQARASDIHLQPAHGRWEVMLRVDGVLSSLGYIQKSGESDLVSRLMVMARLPTYRSGQPMEGRISIPGNEADSTLPARLGVFPTVHGARAVVRILRNDEQPHSLDHLGFDPSVVQQVQDLCQQNDGALLLTGPAGSGKTTTMYAMLRQIAASVPKRSVLTIEDPVEAEIRGVCQSELDLSQGMTLASALRSAVRQDSEVLLVSEVRDPETAEAVMQASMTGHLIFSSVHSTDVAATLKRLVAYGIPTHVVRSGLRAVISQRLLRVFCTQCDHSPAATATCQSCWGTRYHGRTAVAQCVRFDGSDQVGEAFAVSLEAGHSTYQMTRAACEAGYVSLRDQANELVKQGITDEAEVYRVLGS
ncbi:putative type II secretion system protein E [Rubripirellula amarantea]|uniref:Putative type II secretion system protein E n=1 Tax=Rubripirellula amarantea TaxID=2527999 RepID=A0A5C5WI06_9BACT|nr:ATPase, T2SS/T4P/T4SS family [Rubripirellula amarantea]TWT49681.1 putative type II secretion system protein E [Rubripirellula amarantea]